MFTETEKEEMIDFADRITPGSWIFHRSKEECLKVLRDIYKGAKYVVGNLYFDMYFDKKHYDDGQRMGQASGHMWSHNGAASANLTIFYHTQKMIDDCKTVKGTIIHELAHHVVGRYLLWSKEGQKRDRRSRPNAWADFSTSIRANGSPGNKI